jgi:hypothetical protein
MVSGGGRKMIVGLCGAAGSGKDTAGEALEEVFGYVKHRYAGTLKLLLNTMFGWSMSDWDDLEWKEAPNAASFGHSPRYLAQTLGTEWGRGTVHEDIWVEVAMRKAHEARDQLLRAGGMKQYMKMSGASFDPVFVDVRFPNEARAIRDRGGILIFLETNGEHNGTLLPEHESEAWLRWLRIFADVVVTVKWGDPGSTKEAVVSVVQSYLDGAPRYQPGLLVQEELDVLEDLIRSQYS